PVEQLDATPFFVFDLGNRLRDPRPAPPARTLAEPPAVLVDLPAGRDPADPEAEVNVLLGPNDVTDVRLYHNGVPVATSLETALDGDGGPLPRRAVVPVRLVRGANRFYAMAAAAKPAEDANTATFESRSPEVGVDYSGPDEPGRLHVLALGVGDYRRQRLKFAGLDAQRIAEVFHERGPTVEGRQGLRLIRTDGDVSAAGVNADFRRLAEDVRPQDTVVVFLAGHTGVFKAGRFCLLLPSYPFPAEAPVLAMARDAFDGDDGTGEEVDDRHVLPYGLIETNLMRLKALNRLVIVDACQADAIFDDQQVRNIRRWMEVRSRRARTSYLMAARRGEPALEYEGLQHGLFTYALLRGLGNAVDADREPPE
ncbi:MAG: caspase family protein, partial [Thermoleophilia bacterium]|nr:caspase family protein [Thermoleophilia bacterium]